MSRLDHQVLRLEKRVPLRISRGLSTHSDVIWMRWEEAGTTGWGECVPYEIGNYSESLDEVLAALQTLSGSLRDASAWDRRAIEQRLRQEGMKRAVIAGLNQAMLDWMGKVLGRPVWQLFGLSGDQVPVTSVTIGIGSPADARKRVRQWRELHDFKAFKLKLGSKEGIRADQETYEAVREEVGSGARLSVDANGGWSEVDACEMARWLATRGLDHLEQPVPRGQEASFAAIRRASSLPVIADESCCGLADVVALSQLVDGINVKVPKCGGIDEALRTIETARACHLRVLIGCYGSSSLGNSAAAALGALADYTDLDSHLNLADDPFKGARLFEGRLLPSTAPGFGTTHG